MAPEDLLERLAVTLRKEVGPAVEGDYQRTQAFMGAVVLEKIARQLRLADTHRADDDQDTTTMFADLDALLPPDGTPPDLRQAFGNARASVTTSALGQFIESLYAARADLGDPVFTAALARVRSTLRARIDREMEYAR